MPASHAFTDLLALTPGYLGYGCCGTSPQCGNSTGTSHKSVLPPVQSISQSGRRTCKMWCSQKFGLNLLGQSLLEPVLNFLCDLDEPLDLYISIKEINPLFLCAVFYLFHLKKISHSPTFEEFARRYH